MSLTFADIKARFEAERQQAQPLRTRDQLPLAFEDVTAEWLVSVLAPAGSEARVAAFSLSPPDEGTSSRRRIFIDWNDAGRAAGLPASVFCKGTLNLESRFMLALNGGCEAEVAFYQDVRPTLAIEAPRAYFAGFDAHTFNSLLILEDGTDRIEFGRHDLPMSRARAESQMRLLGTLHGTFQSRPDLDTAFARFNTWERYFEATVREAGFGAACPRGFADAESVIPARLFARGAEVWPATLQSVAAHSHLPRTLIHSDVHLKNWYVAANGEMGLMDWQCACRGNWGRDVAYAISTALTVEHRRAWERELLQVYLDSLASAGAQAPTFDAAWRIYRQQLFSALAWWTGTLGQPPEAPQMQPRASSLAFIERMTTAIDDLDALDAFA